MSFIDQLRAKIRQQGPIPFSDYMEEVLHHYYSQERNPIGAGGDYYTSSDLDPIFGRLLAKQFQEWASEISPFMLIELGAGRGLLARDILETQVFPYKILERSESMRRKQQSLLRDFNVEWIDELPAGVTGCIFSNEFFDVLPVHRYVRRGIEMKEIYVTENFEEIEAEPRTPFDAPLADGQIADVSIEARNWIRRIAASLDRGFHLAIDYGYLAPEFFAHTRGTLMCYWRHQAVEDPYVRIGEQDMTAHVNFTDLMEEGSKHSLATVRFTTQMEYLISLGLLDEVQNLSTQNTAASIARLLRIKKLILPPGMGERFKVLVQKKNS